MDVYSDYPVALISAFRSVARFVQWHGILQNTVFRSVARTITRLAEEKFTLTGVTNSHENAIQGPVA